MLLEQKIKASLVKDDDRSNFLPLYFGESLMMIGEAVVYAFAKHLSPDYSGGIWDYHTLDNGGFYMSLDEKVIKIQVNSNYFEREVSADAGSIIINLFALNYLANKYELDSLIDNYYKLRDYALQHDESDLILSAID